MPAFLDVKAKLRNESLLGRFDGNCLVFPSRDLVIKRPDIRSFFSLPFLGIRLKFQDSKDSIALPNNKFILQWIDQNFYLRRYITLAVLVLATIASLYTVKFVFHPLIFFFPLSLVAAAYFYFKLPAERTDLMLIRTGIFSAITMLPLILLLPPFIYFFFAYVIFFLIYFFSSKLKKKFLWPLRLYRIFFWLLLTSGLYEWQLIFLKWRNDFVYQVAAQSIACDKNLDLCSGPGGYWKPPSGWSSTRPNFFTANFNADLTRQIRAFPHALYFHAAGGELFGTLSAADAGADNTLRRIFDYVKENQTYMWALPLPPEIKPEVFTVRGVECMVMALEFYSLKKMGRETLFLLAASPGKTGSFLFLFRLPAQGSLPYYIDRIVSGFTFIERK